MILKISISFLTEFKGSTVLSTLFLFYLMIEYIKLIFFKKFFLSFI